MFLQLEHNVPDVYVEKSRDFQLLCRILDVVLNAAAERASGIVDNLDVDTIEEELLYPLVRRMGFTSKQYFPPRVLKNIAENFPHIIKNKGTIKAIEEAAYTILSAEQAIKYLEVKYNPESAQVTILTSAGKELSDSYIDQLTALLEFIMPAGVVWTYVPSVTTFEEKTDKINNTAKIIRFRGIGAAIAHIIQTQNNILNKGDGLTSRGVDWDELNSKLGYHVDWNIDPKNIPPTESGVEQFYSKVNVVKIIRNEPQPQNVNQIGIDEKE